MAECMKIRFFMVDGDKKWETDIILEGADDVEITTKLLPKTAQEEVAIRILRKTQQSIDYANYVKSMGLFGIS